MIKKISAFVIALLITTASFAFAASFNDFDDSHWAASAVNVLVTEGTVGGYDDGTFKPNGTVTRAEFVKMIGNGPAKFEKDFNDVQKDFWAYDFIMNSGLDGDASGNFNPNVPITRGDVLSLLWKRAGNPVGYSVPKIVSDQGSDKAAIAWGYTNGIMVGNDGMTLRLFDTMTRAEGAVLIIRSREKNTVPKNFSDNLSAALLADVYNSSDLLSEVPYSENYVLTNGELAIVSSRLRCDEQELGYFEKDVKRPFEAPNNRLPYSMDLYLMGRDILGEDKITIEFLNEKANLKDALAVLAYSFSDASFNGPKMSGKDNYYKEISGTLSEAENKALTFAYENDVMLEANKAFSPEKAFTAKDLSAILLQFDHISGIFSKCIYTADDAGAEGKPLTTTKVKTKTPANFDADTQPSNKALYQVIINEIPKKIYEESGMFTPARNPRSNFLFARDFYFVFSTYFVNLAKQSRENGIDVRFTYYPTLCYGDFGGFDMCVKVEILNAAAGSKLSGIADTNIDKSLSSGMTFFMDIKTNCREFGPELFIAASEITKVLDL